MKIKWAALALAGLSAVFSCAATAKEISASSNGGLKVWSDENNAHWFSLGALLQIDQVFSERGLHQNTADFANSAHVRLARLITQGGIGGHWGYYFGIDFAQVNEPAWVNIYLSYLGIENSNIQFGLISPPTSLSNTSVTQGITTMELPMIATALVPPGGLGVYADHQLEMLTFAAALWEPYPTNTANNYPAANPGSDMLGVAGRMTFSPVHVPDYVWHFGVSAVYQKLHQHNNPTDYGFSIPLEMQGRSWPGFAATQLTAESIPSKFWSTAGLEAAALWGPWSIQSEYISASVKAAPGYANQHYSGWYGLIAYSLTGGSKAYDFSSGTFGKVTPTTSKGAWELFGQYSALSLRDHNIGPVAQVVSAGLNWYATPNVKLIAQYERAQYGRLNAGTVNGAALPLERNVTLYGLRLQADFSA